MFIMYAFVILESRQYRCEIIAIGYVEVMGETLVPR